MHGQKSKFVVTELTSVSLICFKHVIAVLPFWHNLILIIIFHSEVEIFFSDGP